MRRPRSIYPSTTMRWAGHEGIVAGSARGWKPGLPTAQTRLLGRDADLVTSLPYRAFKDVVDTQRIPYRTQVLILALECK